MKKILLFFIIITSVSLAIPQIGKSQNPSSEGEEIELTTLQGEHSESNGRSQSQSPVVAFYYPMYQRIEVFFLLDVGNVSVTLTNTSTGQISINQIDSCFGRLLIPVPFGNGNYQIVFHLDDNSAYVGSFII